MAFTHAQLDALEEAIAQGALQVRYADKLVTYRSLDEMMTVRNLMRLKLGLTDRHGGRSYPAMSKGLRGPFGPCGRGDC